MHGVQGDEGKRGRAWLRAGEGGGEASWVKGLSFAGSSPAGVVDEPVSGEPHVSPPQGDLASTISSSTVLSGGDGEGAAFASFPSDGHLCREGLVV